MSEPKRVVLDTNTVMALWFFRDPGLAALQAALDNHRYLPCCRDDALEELRRVLGYRQFAIDDGEQRRILAGYRQRIMLIAPHDDGAEALPQCRDRDDQKFLEISRDAGAAYLLTRDKALLRLGRHRLVRDRFAILTPERFVAEGLC